MAGDAHYMGSVYWIERQVQYQVYATECSLKYLLLHHYLRTQTGVKMGTFQLKWFTETIP